MSPALLFLLAMPVLLVGAVLSLASRSNRSSAFIAIASQTLATGLVVSSILPVLGGGSPIEIVWAWSAPVETIPFRVDALGAFFLAWSLPMTLLGSVYAIGYLKPYFAHGRHGGPHYALLNLVALSFILIYSVQNALVFLLGWEIAAVAAWLLVIWDYRNQKIRFAGFNYLVSTHVGLFVLVAAFMLLHSKTDAMVFSAFGAFLAKPSPSRGTIFVLLGVAFALKSAFFPLHTWLPRAHAAAPAHVSALMSGVIHKAGLFAFLRFTLLMGQPEEWMGWTVLSFGLLSAFFGVLYTSTQRDLKRMLGYSSTENVGIAAVGFGVGYLGWAWNVPSLALAGFTGGLLHLLNHAFFKCLLFYAAGSVFRAAHSVDVERLGGLVRRLPGTALLFLVGALAISALPPFNGFVSELLIYAGLLSGEAPSSQGNMVLIAGATVLAFVGAVSALSMTRAFGLVFLGTPRDRHVHVVAGEPATMFGPMWLHALGVIALGLFPGLGLTAIEAALDLLPFARLAPPALGALSSFVWASRGLAGLLALAVAIGWLRGRHARTSAIWGCGYTAGTPRMQYTGSSFSQPFAQMFEAVLPSLKRERLPEGVHPDHPSHVGTHHADPVEQRMFEVLGQGEELVTRAAVRISEQPRFAFAAGLVVLGIIGLLTYGVGTP